MTALLAAMLLAGQVPDTAPVPLDLVTLFERAEALDGRWVEFDAYVVLIGTRNSHPLLAALTGEIRVLPDGMRAMLCADNTEASFAVLMGETGLAPLRRREARPPNAYAGVRIRAIYRNRPYSWRSSGHEHEWVGLLDNASIVEVTGEHCALTPPEGALPPEE